MFASDAPADTAPDPVVVTLCISTFRRPDGLAALLVAVAGQRVPAGVELRVVVVDNDARGTARDVVAAAPAGLSATYDIEPRAGIPYARSRSVELAAGADFLVFVDDDELPRPGWLAALLDAQRRHGADVVTGPVLPVFEQEPPAWVVRGGFFDRPRFRTGTPLTYARTSNVLVSAAALPLDGPAFPDVAGPSGGSDTYFFRRARLAGASIVWADDACVVEHVPPGRVRVGYLMRRAYRYGNTQSVVLVALEDSPARRAKRAARVAVDTAAGCLLLVAALGGGRASAARGLTRMSYAAGLASGLTGRPTRRQGGLHGPPPGGGRGAGSPARRVVVVSLARFLGGAERSMLAALRRLPAHGWTPVLACPPGGFADAAQAAGVEVRRTTWTQVPAVSVRTDGRKRYSPVRVTQAVAATVANARRVASLARDERADVVVSNSLAAHLFTGAGSRLARRPAVWWLREIVDPGPGRAVLSAAGRATAHTLVAISGAVAGSVRHPRVTVVDNPLEPALPPGPEPAWAGGERPVVGYLGRLDPLKGVDELLAAVPELPGRLVVVGEARLAPPGYVEALRAAADLAAPGRVTFTGAVPDPWDALRAMDVVVLPSWREPFGRVAVEAMAAGTPVVAAAAGGLPEVVEDGVTGLLYRRGDPVDLARQVRRVLDEPGLAARLVAGGRSVLPRFDPDRHAAAVAGVLCAATGFAEALTGTRQMS